MRFAALRAAAFADADQPRLAAHGLAVVHRALPLPPVLQRAPAVGADRRRGKLLDDVGPLLAGRLPAVSVMTRLRPAPPRPVLRRRGGLDQALGGGRGGAEGLLQRRALLPPQLVLEPLDLLDEPVDGLLLLQTPLAVARIRGRGHASSHGSRPRLRSTASRPSRTRAASSARPFSMACLSSGTNSGRTCMHRSFPPSRYV